jgi:hypothetical protein
VLERHDVCFLGIEGCEVSFSDEVQGVHVVFESGDISEELAIKIVESISEHLARLKPQSHMLIKIPPV